VPSAREASQSRLSRKYLSFCCVACSIYDFLSSGSISLHISPNFFPKSKNAIPGFSAFTFSRTVFENSTKDVAGFLGPPCTSTCHKKTLKKIWRLHSYALIQVYNPCNYQGFDLEGLPPLGLANLSTCFPFFRMAIVALERIIRYWGGLIH
jgi:hypothetical protein